MSDNARPSGRNRGVGRALLLFAVVSLGGAVALTVLAFSAGADSEAAILEVTDAVADSTPVTIAPLDPPPAPEPDQTPDDAEASVDERIRAAHTQARLRPVELRIPSIFVRDPVISVGLEDNGELEVPGAAEIGWYRYGAAPGYAGATVLAAHITWNGEYGPFLNLGEVGPGDEIEVALEDGSTRTYQVIERTMYDKDGLPRERIWRNTGDEMLVLITCGGSFNEEINRYRENIVVYAVPVGSLAPEPDSATRFS